MLTKKEADELIKEIKGEARGEVLKVDWDYVNEVWGEEGIKKLEDKMAELGYPLKYKDISSASFYSLGLYNISLLSIRDIFDLDNEEIEKMGTAIVKFSLLIKVLFKYFVSLKLIAEQAPAGWRRLYTVGDLEMSEFSEKKRYVILRIRNFKDHPVHCLLIKGYFVRFSQMIVKFPTTVRETKCVFKGDQYHELLITW